MGTTILANDKAVRLRGNNCEQPLVGRSRAFNRHFDQRRAVFTKRWTNLNV